MAKIIWTFFIGLAFTAVGAQNDIKPKPQNSKQIKSEIMETKKTEVSAAMKEDSSSQLPDKIRIAYVDEPPFYWTDENGKIKGADIELAEIILKAIGISAIEYEHTTFEQLLPGVKAGRWDMNVPIFVTPERAKEVTFSIPVRALGDGFVVLTGNPKKLMSYEAVALDDEARLGIIPGQVQLQTAKSAGVKDSQIVFLKDQHEAVTALLSGKIDAFAATALGNAAIIQSNQGLESVVHPVETGKAPVGAFSFSKKNQTLIKAVNEQLRKFLGSSEHRERMAKYGITDTEIDIILETEK